MDTTATEATTMDLVTCPTCSHPLADHVVPNVYSPTCAGGRWCDECGAAKGQGPKARYTVGRLPGRREGWAVINPTGEPVVGTRTTTRREAFEAAADLGLQVSK